jgi:hypothetical protein
LEKTMKKLASVITAALSLAFAANATAHGSKATHGGIVQAAGDLSFELVSKDGSAIIYIDDHGKARPTASAGGTLTVLKGTAKAVLALTPGPDNTLVAAGANLAPGAKAVAAVTFANKAPVSVRFSVK